MNDTKDVFKRFRKLSERGDKGLMRSRPKGKPVIFRPDSEAYKEGYERIFGKKK